MIQKKAREILKEIFEPKIDFHFPATTTAAWKVLIYFCFKSISSSFLYTTFFCCCFFYFHDWTMKWNNKLLRFQALTKRYMYRKDVLLYTLLNNPRVCLNSFKTSSLKSKSFATIFYNNFDTCKNKNMWKIYFYFIHMISIQIEHKFIPLLFYINFTFLLDVYFCLNFLYLYSIFPGFFFIFYVHFKL